MVELTTEEKFENGKKKVNRITEPMIVQEVAEISPDNTPSPSLYFNRLVSSILIYCCFTLPQPQGVLLTLLLFLLLLLPSYMRKMF